MDDIDSIDILQSIISYDTTSNGKSGDSARCIGYLEGLFKDAGIPAAIINDDPERPSLYAKLRSPAPSLSPLLLFGHVDVPPECPGQWEADPFSGVFKDGCVYGRGAAPKGAAAIFVSLMLKLRRARLPYDLMLIITSGGSENDHGMSSVVKRHPKLFNGVVFAIGGEGGFSFNVDGKKLYPITIAEAQSIHLRVTAFGQTGVTTEPRTRRVDKAMAVNRIARALTRLETHSLPVRVTEPARLMMDAIGKNMGELEELVLKQLAKPYLTRLMLKLMRKNGRYFAPVLKNSVTATVIRGGGFVGEIPAEASFEADLRLVPEVTVEEGVQYIRAIIGEGYEIEALGGGEGSAALNMDLFDGLSKALREQDPEALPVPCVYAEPTDGRFLAGLGIQTFGYAPMNLPHDFNLLEISQKTGERLPVDALAFGAEVLTSFITRHRKK